MESMCRLEGFGCMVSVDLRTSWGEDSDRMIDLLKGTRILTNAEGNRYRKVLRVVHGENELYRLGFSGGTSLDVTKGQVLKRHVGGLDGWVTVGALAVGDSVWTDCGRRLVVLESFELLGVKDVYNVVIDYRGLGDKRVSGHTFFPNGFCALDYSLVEELQCNEFPSFCCSVGPKSEKVLCAAIRRKVPRDSNGLSGDIYSCELGYRHCDIIARFRGELSEEPDAQGFFTSHGRFVSREEAAKLSVLSGQVTRKDIEVLYTEDLY